MRTSRGQQLLHHIGWDYLTGFNTWTDDVLSLPECPLFLVGLSEPVRPPDIGILNLL